AGRVGARDLGRPLDTGIIGPQWLSLPQMQAQPGQMRSALVLRCVEDYLAGQRYPLNILQRL
ncbi:MAG: NUDIX hydrolase, partial [Acidithiobacillus ferrivorans]